MERLNWKRTISRPDSRRMQIITVRPRSLYTVTDDGDNGAAAETATGTVDIHRHAGQRRADGRQFSDFGFKQSSDVD